VLLLAASLDGEGIGFVSGVEMRHPDKDAEMFIYELGVDEAWRRHGVAKELLSALRDLAVQRGCRGMWTGTDADNEAALATYKSLGATVDDTSVFIAWDDLLTP
jgi:ribosomal protein S18 acetylase RimI-like enzyme